MNPYRTHTCGELRETHVGTRVMLSGWVDRVRELGGIAFLVLRDHHGSTQIVFHSDHPQIDAIHALQRESVVRVEGEVVLRDSGTVNDALPTGRIELRGASFDVLSASKPTPFVVVDDVKAGEDTRLKYRYLDLRRRVLHERICMRSRLISSLRRRMEALGFLDIHTPILTSTSPEGARDFVVPARLYPGKFYALPQAPQQFKQLLMTSGFDRYYQIAPCFRDEAGRSDRSPGEFYQLDLELAFATQEDVFATIETVLPGLFREFTDFVVSEPPFRRIPYREALSRFGSDKPDLRFDLEIQDVTEWAAGSTVEILRGASGRGDVVRLLAIPGAASQSRKFYGDLDERVKAEGGAGILWFTVQEDGGLKGGLANRLSEADVRGLLDRVGGRPGCGFVLLAGPERRVAPLCGLVRVAVADALDLRRKGTYEFCWIVDFPMYERNADTGQIEFSHNPFSMPQGGLTALTEKDPLDILAWQYDLVCNGVELSSGAVRNNDPELMVRAFEIAGYAAGTVEEMFGALYHAFQHGAPPHAGIAPGIERMLMLLTQQTNLREVTPFPLTVSGQDLLMNAPRELPEERLAELHLAVRLPQAPKE